MANKKSSKKEQKNKHKLLKMIARGIYYFLSKIYNILDKVVITPLAKLMLFVMKPFKGSGKIIDKLLNNKLVLITVSLMLSLGAFMLVDNKTEILMNNTADILYSRQVTALYNEEAYVVEGLPKTVDITLIGRRADLYLAKQYPNDEVVVDLRDLKPGTHKVNLKYTGSVSSVKYKLDPSTVNITIHEKLSEEKKLTTEILNEDKIDQKLIINDVILSRDEIYVKGQKSKLKQIATVKALVNVADIETPQTGTNTLKNIPLVAYDKKGSKVNVEIVPANIDARIEIASPSKEVPFKITPEGKVVFGKAIDEIKLSHTKATIYGKEDVLEKISYIPVNINVEGINEETEYTVNVSMPSGVRDISTKSIVATVTLGDEKEKTIKNVNISPKNLESGLTAQAATKADSLASVIVKGTQDNIKDASIENVSAFVNLQGLGKGTHTVDVEVTGDNAKLNYIAKTKKVTIIIK